MAEVLDLLHREFVYVWYYFTVQLEQIFGWWVLGMVLGSAISVFARDRLHGLFRALSGRRLGALGVIPASLLGDRVAALHVRDHPHCRLLCPAGDAP